MRFVLRLAFDTYGWEALRQAGSKSWIVLKTEGRGPWPRQVAAVFESNPVTASSQYKIYGASCCGSID